MAAPEASYTAQPGTDTPAGLRDLVRLLAGDTGREGEFFLADTEVDWNITERLINGVARPYLSSADCLDEMAARVAQRSDLRRVGDVQAADTRDSLISKFSNLAKVRRAQSITRDPGYAAAVQVMGGVDDDHPRYFRTGDFAYPGSRLHIDYNA